jgi:hypothetical protein
MPCTHESSNNGEDHMMACSVAKRESFTLSHLDSQSSNLNFQNPALRSFKYCTRPAGFIFVPASCRLVLAILMYPGSFQ